MIRENLNANSAHASMFTSPGNGTHFVRRTSTGSGSTATSVGGLAPTWLKIVRSGNIFSGYLSSDGTTWTLVGTDTIPMANNAYIGMAVSAANNSVLNTSTFDNVNVIKAPDSIVAIAGSDQSTAGNTTFETPLQARVIDMNGLPLANTAVTFSAPITAATGTFIIPNADFQQTGNVTPSATVTVTTDANGLVTAPTFNANTTNGPYAVSAVVSGSNTPAKFNVSNTTPCAYAISAGYNVVASIGNNQMGSINTTFNNLFVTVYNYAGQRLCGVRVNFFAPVPGQPGGTFGGQYYAQAVTDNNGIASVGFTANGTTGSYNVTATTGMDPNATNSIVKFNLTNEPPDYQTPTSTSEFYYVHSDWLTDMGNGHLMAYQYGYQARRVSLLSTFLILEYK